MSPRSDTAQNRLKNVTKCLATTADTLKIIANSMDTPFLEAILNTTQSISECAMNKDECTQLMEGICDLLNTIILVQLKSNTGGELPPSTLKTLHKIHTFVESQQSGNKLMRFLHREQMGALLSDCKKGLQQDLDHFRIQTFGLARDIEEMQECAQKRYHEVLEMIETLSDAERSDQVSSLNTTHSGYNSSTSISMLPSEPKIFHGRESELSHILESFSQGTPRITILGAAGMGKTSLARAVVHHADIVAKYEQYRFFVACDQTATKIELVSLIGAHLGLKAGDGLEHVIIHHFSCSPPSLVIVDNLETVWEPMQNRGEIEEFLSLLTDVPQLAIMPLQPLSLEAARQTFADIADTGHNQAEVDKVLALTDNVPLAISLLAHLADSGSCSTVLSLWEEERTSLVSEECYEITALDFSISLSLSSPRLRSLPQSLDLLSLLSILPDGLSNVELTQSQLPLRNILSCKAALIGTALAYTDEHNRLKVLLPIRDHVHRVRKPGEYIIAPLLQYFRELLELFVEDSTSQAATRISLNYANIQNLLCNSLQEGHTDLICISNPEIQSMVGQALEHLKHFEDTDLKCKLYNSLAFYYTSNNHIDTAMKFCQDVLSLSSECTNTKERIDALYRIGWIKWQLGENSAGQKYASEAQQLAQISGDFYREAQALDLEITCWYVVGNFKHSMLLCDRAKKLVTLCGISGGELDHTIMTSQAEVHKLKSEYLDAHKIHTQILRETSQNQVPFMHGLALLNVAEIDLALEHPRNAVQKSLDKAKLILESTGNIRALHWCSTFQADLKLSEADISGANELFQKSLTFSRGEDAALFAYCLEGLGNSSRWGAADPASDWTFIFLAHSLKSEEILAVHKALQFLGDVFMSQGDEITAISLFTVALAGFTSMDVHRSRAECMLHLGDIYKECGDLLKAVELWDTARPLFVRSSQNKQVKSIDERLASVGQVLLEEHRKNVAGLAEHNVLSRTIEEAEKDSSNTEVSDVAEEKGSALVLV
ncbi:hypothetical protein DFH06DRAFT_1310650 [Mycena polygramma]|nr:hypothetical protein DFH06DRAFT_1310650 [Mycena polygramma]